jgi:Uma2 family endonuclease
MATPAVDLRTRHWTREEYERMGEQGFFRPDERVELVDGVIYEMTPQGGLHATVVWKAHEILRSSIPSGFFIRSQMPLALTADSEPEPDIAVIRGDPEDFSDRHPEKAVLVVEVADASLFHDTGRKKSLYARAGVPDCWIFNLRKKELEVNRDPMEGVYRSRQVLRLGEIVSPLFAPGVTMPVINFFPLRFQDSK